MIGWFRCCPALLLLLLEPPTSQSFGLIGTTGETCRYEKRRRSIVPNARHLASVAQHQDDITLVVAAANDTRNTEETVKVWDNVIDNTIQQALHETTCQMGLGRRGHCVFSRNSTTGPTNDVEKALDSILTAMDDDSNFVEYWTRQEWRSIAAHADVDEYKAKREQQQQNQQLENGGGVPPPLPPFRYPFHGHVLYVRVGSQVRGPTCVFPGRKSGGELLTNVQKTGSSDDTLPVEMVTIPAFPGRLLRFRGDFLHAVPRPTDLWLLTFVQGAPQFEPEEDWGRSVILFNTWGAQPPAEVPVSQVFSREDADDGSSHDMGCCDRKDWIQAYDSENPERKHQSVEEETGEDHVPAKIWLLGDYRRRGHRMQTLKLEAPESLRKALHQERDVTSLQLRQPKS